MSCNASILSCISFAPQLSCPDINLFFLLFPSLYFTVFCIFLRISGPLTGTHHICHTLTTLYSSQYSCPTHALFTIHTLTVPTTRSNHTTVLTLFTLLTVPTCSITFLWEFKVVLRSRPFLAAPAPGSSILAAPAPARLRLGLRLRGV